MPAQFRIVVTRRPQMRLPVCENGVLQSEAPARLIEDGLPTEATVAQDAIGAVCASLDPCR